MNQIVRIADAICSDRTLETARDRVQVGHFRTATLIIVISRGANR